MELSRTSVQGQQHQYIAVDLLDCVPHGDPDVWWIYILYLALATTKSVSYAATAQFPNEIK